MLSSRQPGLAHVYDELVGFKGNEFHFVPVPTTLFDVEFRDACLHFSGCVVIGIYTSSDAVMINPLPDLLVGDGDDFIVICESLDSVEFLNEPIKLPPYTKMETSAYANSGKKRPPKERFSAISLPVPEPLLLSASTSTSTTIVESLDSEKVHPVKISGPDMPSDQNLPGKDPEEAEKILICGWRRNLRDIIIMLNMLATKKCSLHILCEIPVEKRIRMLTDDGLNIERLCSLELVHFVGSSSRRSHLENLCIEEYSAILIVADLSLEHNAIANDSHALASLLLIRNLQKTRGLDSIQISRCTIICEFLDNRARFMTNTNENGGNDGGSVHSHDIVSRAMAMIAARPQLKVVLDELLEYEGASIYVKPLSRYAGRREMVSFWTIAQRAWDYNEILIGRFMPNLGIIEMNPETKEAAESWMGYRVLVIAKTMRHKDNVQRKTRYNAYRNSNKLTSHVMVGSTSFLNNSMRVMDRDDDERDMNFDFMRERTTTLQRPRVNSDSIKERTTTQQGSQVYDTARPQEPHNSTTQQRSYGENTRQQGPHSTDNTTEQGSYESNNIAQRGYQNRIHDCPIQI